MFIVLLCEYPAQCPSVNIDYVSSFLIPFPSIHCMFLRWQQLLWDSSESVKWDASQQNALASIEPRVKCERFRFAKCHLVRHHSINA